MTNFTEPLTDLAQALADESRVRILLGLRGRELCVCQIVEWVGLAPSTVSGHLSLLRSAGLVTRRKSGRWIFYRRAAPSRTETAVRGALAWIDRAAKEDPRFGRDLARLDAVLQVPPEELCRTSRSR